CTSSPSSTMSPSSPSPRPRRSSSPRALLPPRSSAPALASLSRRRRTMTAHGHRLFFLMIIFLAAPLIAQQPTTDDRIHQLETRMDDLTRQMGEIRQQINQLKGQPAAAEDLTKIEVAQPAVAATEQPQSALTDVTTI